MGWMSTTLSEKWEAIKHYVSPTYTIWKKVDKNYKRVAGTSIPFSDINLIDNDIPGSLKMYLRSAASFAYGDSDTKSISIQKKFNKDEAFPPISFFEMINYNWFRIFNPASLATFSLHAFRGIFCAFVDTCDNYFGNRKDDGESSKAAKAFKGIAYALSMITDLAIVPCKIVADICDIPLDIFSKAINVTADKCKCSIPKCSTEVERIPPNTTEVGDEKKAAEAKPAPAVTLSEVTATPAAAEQQAIPTKQHALASYSSASKPTRNTALNNLREERKQSSKHLFNSPSNAGKQKSLTSSRSSTLTARLTINVHRANGESPLHSPNSAEILSLSAGQKRTLTLDSLSSNGSIKDQKQAKDGKQTPTHSPVQTSRRFRVPSDSDQRRATLPVFRTTPRSSPSSLPGTPPSGSIPELRLSRMSQPIRI